MNSNDFTLVVTGTKAVCPVGETTGRNHISTGAIPVFSCEGACIRGEIARLAANRVARTAGYARGCHGELFAAPDSQMARWVKQASHVVVIDGCHLRCHGRIIENLVGKDRVRGFDALAHYRKYGDVFDIDGVPEPERQAIADGVAGWVREKLRAGPAVRRCSSEAAAAGEGGGCGA